jgi:hypothetical protein
MCGGIARRWPRWSRACAGRDSRVREVPRSRRPSLKAHGRRRGHRGGGEALIACFCSPPDRAGEARSRGIGPLDFDLSEAYLVRREGKSWPLRQPLPIWLRPSDAPKARPRSWRGDCPNVSCGGAHSNSAGNLTPACALMDAWKGAGPTRQRRLPGRPAAPQVQSPDASFHIGPLRAQPGRASAVEGRSRRHGRAANGRGREAVRLLRGGTQVVLTWRSFGRAGSRSFAPPRPTRRRYFAGASW